MEKLGQDYGLFYTAPIFLARKDEQLFYKMFMIGMDFLDGEFKGIYTDETQDITLDTKRGKTGYIG